MRFRIDQAHAVARGEVEGAFTDPAFYASATGTSNLGRPELLRIDESDERVHVAVRYQFTGQLAAPARRILDPAKLSWVTETTLERSTHRAEFRLVPDHYGDRLECSGSYRLEERGAMACMQTVEGDLVVHVPLVGRSVERAIEHGIRQHLIEEATAVGRWATRQT
ncbi:MAG TPA: DUF2505 family protein [Acidimicrobiales bacterium]|nr:DUF2505 family protein [Acidimicrobiales bacterium]